MNIILISLFTMPTEDQCGEECNEGGGCANIFMVVLCPFITLCEMNRAGFPNNPNFYKKKSFRCLCFSAFFGVFKSAVLCPCLFCGYLHKNDGQCKQNKDCPIFHTHPCTEIYTRYIDKKSCREICEKCCKKSMEEEEYGVRRFSIIITAQPGGKASKIQPYEATLPNIEQNNLPKSCNDAFYRPE